MIGYFKPLRRKIGVATLVVACVLAVGWARSIFVRDMCFQMHNWRQVYFISNDGVVIGSIAFVRPDPKDDKSHLGLKWTTDKAVPFMGLRDEEGCDFNWQSGRLRFIHVGENSYCRSAIRWSIPFWHITVPLTLLSAWLLLSKPRTVKGAVNEGSP